LGINFKELLIFLKPRACSPGMDVGHNRMGTNGEMGSPEYNYDILGWGRRNGEAGEPGSWKGRIAVWRRFEKIRKTMSVKNLAVFPVGYIFALL
jgi:hypothetical protein